MYEYILRSYERRIFQKQLILFSLPLSLLYLLFTDSVSNHHQHHHLKSDVLVVSNIQSLHLRIH